MTATPPEPPEPTFVVQQITILDMLRAMELADQGQIEEMLILLLVRWPSGKPLPKPLMTDQNPNPAT